MELKSSQKQTCRQTAAIRKTKGLSRGDLAKRIETSRLSSARKEPGNRGIDALELHKFPLDEFLSPDFEVSGEIHPSKKEEPAKENAIRISIPGLQVNKFTNVLLYILEQCAGKPNMGETVLNRLLYFCDFNYCELYEEHLTGARYKKLAYGPVPQKSDSILNRMIDKGQLKRIKTEYHGFPQTRYLPLEKAGLTQLSTAEKTVIDDVIRQMSDWNANKISEYSHRDKPWKATGEGDYISYNSVFYRRPPFSVREYPEDEQD